MRGVDCRRSVGQRIATGLRLREGDDLTNVGLADQQRSDAVDAKREPSVGRGAEAEGVKQEAEFGVALLFTDPQ